MLLAGSFQHPRVLVMRSSVSLVYETDYCFCIEEFQMEF